jgi:hypothetical protein
LAILTCASACAVLVMRPVQDMSDTQSAIRAAREVQADTLAPELFRNATEWFFRARQEYKFKNFQLAKEYSDKARFFAEQAEFEAIRNGGNRTDSGPSDPIVSSGGGGGGPSEPSKPEAYPTPTGTPIESFSPPPSTSNNPPPPLPGNSGPTTTTPPVGGPANLGALPTPGSTP